MFNGVQRQKWVRVSFLQGTIFYQAYVVLNKTCCRLERWKQDWSSPSVFSCLRLLEVILLYPSMIQKSLGRYKYPQESCLISGSICGTATDRGNWGGGQGGSRRKTIFFIVWPYRSPELVLYSPISSCMHSKYSRGSDSSTWSDDQSFPHNILWRHNRCVCVWGGELTF